MNFDPPPMLSSVDTSPKTSLSLSSVWQQWFSQLHGIVKRSLNFKNSMPQVPVNGFSVTIAEGSNTLTLNPAGVLATGTVVLPANPYDGQVVIIMSTFAVTALTLSPSGSETVKNAPTSLSAGTGVAYYYNESTTTWFRFF